MPGGNGGPGEGVGKGFLRNKADRRGIDGLMVFITDLLPITRRVNMTSTVLVERDSYFRKWLKINISTLSGLCNDLAHAH